MTTPQKTTADPASGPSPAREDGRHHVPSFLMRESLLDKQVMASTDTPVIPMLRTAHFIKIGGRSITDKGRAATYPLIDAIGAALKRHKLVISSGGGIRSRHAYFIGTDLGMPTGVLAQLSLTDTLGKAYILGTLLAPHGVVAVPPDTLIHMLPFFVQAVPGIIFNGEPPFALWEHLPRFGRIPPHRTDAGSYLLAECFGAANLTLIKDVDGLYEQDPKTHAGAAFIKDITVVELQKRNLRTLPFDRVLLDLLACARQCKRFQIINGLKPELLEPALRGEHVGTIVRMDESS